MNRYHVVIEAFGRLRAVYVSAESRSEAIEKAQEIISYRVEVKLVERPDPVQS